MKDEPPAIRQRGRRRRDPFATLSPSALGFGVVPGTPEEARAHVQIRIRAYLGLFAILWTGMFLALQAAERVAGIRFLGGEHAGVIASLHVGEAALLTCLWVLLGRRQSSLKMLDIIDAGATMTQSVALIAMLLLGGSPVLRTDLVILLALTNLLAGRAALVPCTVGRTAILGAGSIAPLPVATYLVYARPDVPAALPSALTLALSISVWSCLAGLLSVAITRVIYGLERRVKEATQLGQYTLESQIGAGGMGTVFLARHTLLRRPTAIKLLPPDKAGKAAIKRFEREVQLTSQLTHPNIVAIYDYGRTPDGLFYYAMEYLEGTDLERLVKEQGSLAPSRVRHIVRQIADALAEAHAVKLIHRDIKPANIVVLSRGRQHDYVKVLDFGLVKELRPDKNAPSLSSVAMLIGTPNYISPESITDPSKVDHRSDIYALGAVAYFLLTGTNAVKGKSVVEVCAWHMYEKPEPPSARLGRSVPASLEKLILQCLEKDSAKRPQSAAAIVEALDLASDVPNWTAADAAAAWSTPSAEQKSTGPIIAEMDSTLPAQSDDHDTPAPASRAMAVDLQNR